MSKIHRLIWKGGEIEVDTLGCKMILYLILMDVKSNLFMNLNG